MMKKCKACGIVDAMTVCYCGSTDLEPATYQDVLDQCGDPLYAAELTGNVEAARGILKDYKLYGPGGQVF
jgi:hypothetical protein